MLTLKDEELEVAIDEYFGNCLTAENLCVAYAELYAYIVGEMMGCMKYFTDEEIEIECSAKEGVQRVWKSM